MYKLTVISGPNRGTSYLLQEGELTIGRQSGNRVVLQSSKVSKSHCSIQMRAGKVSVRDLGSSNGTFVNGILIRQKDLKLGDRVSVGEFVFELVEPSQRVPKMAPAVSGLGSPIRFPSTVGGGLDVPVPGVSPGGGDLSGNQAPKDLVGRISWAFENNLMPFFYGYNLKNEWNSIGMILVAVFLVGNLVLTVYPLLESNKKSILKETSRRAKFVARQISETNAPFLAVRAETKTEIGIAENAEGVRTAVLVDLDNRIIAPGSKLNQYLTAGNEASLAVRARDLFRNGRETGLVQELEDTVIAIEPVKVINPSLGRNVVVAMAVVSIDASLALPDIGEMGIVYSEALILTGMLGVFLFFILYKLTLKPFLVLNEDLDKVLKGEAAQVSHDYRLSELDALWDIINAAVQRIPRAGSSQDNMGISGGDLSNFLDEVLSPLKVFGELGKYGLVIFNSDKKIAYINPLFEEISGIRADGALGADISDVARDQSLGQFAHDIMGRAPAGGEAIHEDYDFSGVGYRVYTAAFGSGGMSKGYLMVVARTEA